jgi:hypothetical protein
MSHEITIHIVGEITDADLLILRRYLADAIQFSEAEWRQLRNVIDRLAQSELNFDERRYTFRRFYTTYINGTYARPFLQQLQSLADLQREGAALQASLARKIMNWLASNGLSPTQVPHADLLLIYCLYWWAAFARGYLFEQVIIRDLLASQVLFTAHEVTYGRERYSQYDLQISGMGKGDIKTSLYFLDDFPDPPADFYITQLYDARQGRLQRVVFLLPDHWKQINGAPKAATITNAPQLFPAPVSLQISGKHWVMVEYSIWKSRLLRWQAQGDTDDR